MIKITKMDINNCNNNIYGHWINETIKPKLNPFPYTIIDNFLNNDTYNKINKEFANKPDDTWWKYNNPLEVKYAKDDIYNFGTNTKNLFYSLSSDKIINKMKEIFNIPDLEYDPYCHGGGLHMHPRNGRLNMHLDYEIHPYSKKKRRLNIILYMNEEWNKEWNGDTQLWNNDMSKCIIKSLPSKNKALIFVTTDFSWHGIPEKILCPNNIHRKTVAFYYVSDNDEEKKTYRDKAVFIKRPEDKYDERLDKLFKIRAHRRISNEDMKEIWPEWINSM